MKTILTILISLVTIVGSVLGQETEPDYLCFKVTKGTKISLKRVIGNTYESVYKPNPKIQYSIDKETWKDLSLSKEITININCNVYFRGNNPDGISNINNYVYFSVSKSFECSGNLMTLIDGVGEVTQIPNLHGCFNYLFSECPLTTAPKLPATTLVGSCYAYMFKNCTLLKTPPALPATTLAICCYQQMFAGCTSLEEAPKLPATTLASLCYECMFSSSAISIAPELPATQLEGGCYRSMFSNCNNLVAMPKIYATQFTTSSCDRMFSYCDNLSYISVNFKTWSSNSPDSEKWVNGVSSTGTFVCPRSLSKIYNVNRIPPTWKIKYIEDLHSITIPESSKPYITINKTIELDKGDEVSFSITDRTDEGYTATVTVQGTDIIETTQSGNDYSFTMPAEDVTISVTYSSTPINYTITTDDYSTVDKTEASEGETVNVTFKDRGGYNLTSATYNGTELTITNNTSTFTMPAANVTIATTYTKIDYTITADQYSTPNKTTANVGDEITVTFAKRDGYNLTSATYNGTALNISNNTATFTMPAANVTIATTYTKIDYTITADQYSTPNKTKANVGDEITVTFANRDGYSLTSATYNGTALNISNNTASFTMPAANVTIASTYTKIDYTITADQYSTPNKTKANVGDEITVSFANRDGYSLTSATYNGTALNITNNTASFTMPAANVTITTTYTKIDYTITADQYSTPNKTTANFGDEITVTFANRDGYTLTSATYNDNPLTITNGTASFTMPAAAVSIATTYTPINYTINKGDYIDVDKTTATINDKVTITVTDRTAQGYQLTKVLANTTEVAITNYIGEIDMKDYLTDVNITAEYSKIEYYLYYEAYARPQPQRLTAYVGDVIYLIIANRPGYELYSVTYNDIELTFADFKASFVMPAANVTIKTKYRPIIYNIICADDNVSVDKSTAVVLNTVSINVVDRTAQGYQLTKVLANTTEVPITDFKGEIEMKYYVCDVTISAEYKKIGYAITSDNYATPNKTTANVGDEITVDFATRPGYNLTSATYNSNVLTITNGAASFTMPAAAVTIATTYTPIVYNITTDQYITADKPTATLNDKVTFTVADRSAEGLLIEKVLINNAEFSGTTFNMADYLTDVTITAMYSKIGYTINSDAYSTPNKTTANVGDEITVTFANRDGYNLTSATYNGNPLTITNNTASFTMPAANVTIATTYTPIEYNVTAGEYVTANKSKATINDQVSFTVADRTADGYQLDKVLINNTEFSGTSFNMADYLTDVTITAVYSKINYSIITDEHSSADKNSANVGDKINVNFSNIPGYYIFRAVCNGNELIVEDYGSWFTMPAENAYVATSYLPIEYNITAGEYVTANKAKATINDQVSFTVADRTADGYQLNKVLINNTEFSGTSFNMADYLTDVTITAVYSKIGYTITSDAYSTPSKTKANVGDEITVTFSKRDGYNLTSATYNGTALTIVDYKSQFTMPDEDVEIKTVYTVEQQQITKPEIITDNNVEITLPENLTENTEVTFTVQQKPGYTAFVYVNGVLTNECKFVFTGKVEIKVDYKELTVSNISAETESYCAGDEINLTFATNPYAVEYELTFSNEAQKEGFENIDFLPVKSYEKQPASFKIPQSAKPGKYHAFISVKDAKDSHSKQYVFDFEVLYPTDIIETKYSDLICVNNSKNEYIGYQWFKNNKEIKGADKQFYIDAPMLNGSYSVALILKNGEKIRTCNYIVSNPTLKKSLKPSVNVYPNPAKSSAPIVVELSEMDDLTDAYILIYNQLGVQIDKISNLTPHNTLSLKKGFYHGVVICGSTKLTFKIIVNE